MKNLKVKETQQLTKSFSEQCKVKLQKTLNFSQDIISKKINISETEKRVKFSDSFSQPTLKSVFKNHGVLGFSLINFLITRFMESFSFSTKMNDEQLEMLTVDTIDAFEHETLVDVILFFKMVRSGKFGETKRGVDSNLIYGKWFPMYLKKKAELREKLYLEKKSERNSISVSAEDVKISYEKNRLKSIKANADSYVADLTKNMDRQMLEDTIIQWEKDDSLKNYLPMLKSQRRVIRK